MHCCSGDVRRVPPGNQSSSFKIGPMKKCLKDVTGLDVEMFVEHWHWDGKIEAEEVFTEEFEHAIGHV